MRVFSTFTACWFVASCFQIQAGEAEHRVSVAGIPPQHGLISRGRFGKAVGLEKAVAETKPGRNIIGRELDDSLPQIDGRIDVAKAGENRRVKMGPARLRRLELREAACADADVVAVAFWPNVVLEPGAGTEVYVLRRKAPVAKSTTRRPFLAVGARQ